MMDNEPRTDRAAGAAMRGAAVHGLSRWRAWAAAARVALAALAAGLSPLAAQAWSQHALATRVALEAMPELAGRSPVPAQALEALLLADPDGLAAVLEQLETRARAEVPNYPPRPDALRFVPDTRDPVQLRARFLAALRLNPQSRLSLYVGVPPGVSAGDRPTRDWREVTTLEKSDTIKRLTFLALREGQAVDVVEVLAAASDEPDHGLDIGLWEDNGTEYGRRYGFGRQPFGNPALEFASQAPLHMGFFHEADIVYRAAPFLRRTFPDARVIAFSGLARFAFSRGHDYWGWRFAGWALHYLQDLTQPYHASVLPGRSTAGMLWINALDLMGWSTPKHDAITLVSNRHLGFENYQLHRLTEALLARGDGPPGPLLQSLQPSPGAPAAPFSQAEIRGGLTREAVGRAHALDAGLARHMPPRIVDDPGYTLGVSEPEPNLADLVRQQGRESQAALDALLAERMRALGGVTRALVQQILRER